MSDELMHEKYGQIYLSGSGIGSSAYVKAWSEKQGKIIDAYLCVKCGDPIIDAPEEDLFEGLIDACAHKECLMKHRRRS
jgi:hypothetical protein